MFTELMASGSGGGGSEPLILISESVTASVISLNDLEIGHDYYLVMSSAGTASNLVIQAVQISATTDCTYEAISPARWVQPGSAGAAMSIYKIVPTATSITITKAYNLNTLYTLIG